MFIKDEEFIRGKCPMTKEDIRILSIAKLNLQRDSKVLDIGSGTGSMTVQSSKFCTEGIVYSIERDEDAIDTTLRNLDKFKCNNVEFLQGDAIGFLNGFIKSEEFLEWFDSIFIGGSGGDLDEIIHCCHRLLKDKGTIVLNFITLDNAYKAIEVLNGLNYKVDITLANISKNREHTYMMISNNPIFILQGIKEEEH